MNKKSAPSEDRTHGLQIMRLTRCLLRYRGFAYILYFKKKKGCSQKEEMPSDSIDVGPDLIHQERAEQHQHHGDDEYAGRQARLVLIKIWPIICRQRGLFHIEARTGCQERRYRGVLESGPDPLPGARDEEPTSSPELLGAGLQLQRWMAENGLQQAPEPPRDPRKAKHRPPE